MHGLVRPSRIIHALSSGGKVLDLVRQQHEEGCGIACVAMLCGMSYRSVYRAARDKFYGIDAATDSKPRNFNTTGLNVGELHELLDGFGIRSMNSLSSLAGSSPEKALLGQTVILAVDRRQDGGHHWVVWNAHRILDPNKPPARRTSKGYHCGSYLRLGS